MKVNIWIKKEDVLTGKITEYLPYITNLQGGTGNYVQISITQDEFAQLEDRNLEENDWDSNYWLTEQYNRNREHKDQRIFERNPDNGTIKSRIAGDYGNERIEDDYSNREKLDEKIKQARIVIEEVQDYINVTGGEFKDWFNNLSKAAKTIYRDELERRK